MKLATQGETGNLACPWGLAKLNGFGSCASRRPGVTAGAHAALLQAGCAGVEMFSLNYSLI
ncbi:MAG: hypothetical protein WC708_19140 [Lentisphaeria bacterium]